MPARSSALFCAKNALSAHLMRSIAEQHRHRLQFAVGNLVVDDGMAENVAQHLESDAFDRLHRSWSPALLGDFLALWLAYYLRGERIYLYHTLSYGLGVVLKRRWLFPPHTRVVIEHGLADTTHFIDVCAGRRPRPRGRWIYLFSFYDELMAYLARAGLKPWCEVYPYPHVRLPAPPAAGGVALFAIQPIVDDGVLAEDVYVAALERLLGRQSARAYKLKPHPRKCERTLEIVQRVLRRRGHEFSVIPTTGPLELEFPTLGCSSVLSFYSTATMLVARLYGVPADDAIADLIRGVDFRKEYKLHHLKLLAELFGRHAA